MSPYIKIHDVHTKWKYFLIESDELSENIMISGINSILVRRKN